MNRISKVFSSGKKTLIVYLTAGFPEPGMDEELVLTAIDAGADIIELGFPFSDPVADGPLIQQASRTALEMGMTLAGTVDLAARIRQQRETPILLMGYANPVYHMGYVAFAGNLAEAGADGAIIPDLPMEAAGPLRDEMRARELALIPMAAPNTPPERLRSLIEEGDGFLYLVSMAGLTGDALKSGTPWKTVARMARASGRLPVCVGFGISSGPDAAEAAGYADGVIVGSAVTARINQAGNLEEAKSGVRELVKELAEAIRKAPA
ncbi:MAG: tryptophan synthase subunit alpha [bacterium]|nr:tryptophan synthase subunit alpha [bacterium]